LHPFHLKWIVQAINAGKHVLCEKPMTMNLREAKVVQKVASDKKRLLREAFMWFIAIFRGNSLNYVCM